MRRKKILALVITASVLVSLALCSPISAAKGGDNPSKSDEKPGHGIGDQKHRHYGPPGHEEPGDRPGWGWGDRNHHHYGYGYCDK